MTYLPVCDYHLRGSFCSKLYLSFDLQIVPQLVAGKHVMIAAHGNSLRSIIMHLDKLTSQEVIYLFSGITFHYSEFIY